MALATTRPVLWSPNTVTGLSVTTPGSWVGGDWVQVLSSAPADCAIAYLMAKCLTSGVVTTDGVMEIGWGLSSESVCLAASYPFTIGQSLVGSTWDLELPIPITLIPAGKKVFVRYRNSAISTQTIDSVSLGYYAGYDSSHKIDLTLYRQPTNGTAPLITSPASLWTFSSWVSMSTGFTDAVYVAGVTLLPNDDAVRYPETEIELGIGAGPTGIGTIPAMLTNGEGTFLIAWLPRVVPVAKSTAISARIRMNTATATAIQVGLYYYGEPAVGCVPVPPTPPIINTETVVIRRMRRTPHLNQLHRRITFSSFEILAQVGEGLISGQGVDPQIMLRWSDDGGRTWSLEHWTSLGKMGQYRTRVLWRRLGQARDRIFEVVVSDPVDAALITAYIGANVGTS